MLRASQPKSKFPLTPLLQSGELERDLFEWPERILACCCKATTSLGFSSKPVLLFAEQVVSTAIATFLS